MKEHKRIAGGECPLPPEILEHIQSFMNREEAARSTILSKSLYSSWTKRPILEIDQRDVEHLGAPYTEIIYKTINDFVLHIQTSKLWMEPTHHQPLAKESMAKAMKMGASELKLELWTPLPSSDAHELGSETLVRLSVTGCSIDLWPKGKVTRSNLLNLLSSGVMILCSKTISFYPLLKSLKFCGRLEYEFHKLESLSLEWLRFLDTLFFPDLFSKFPCLRNLKLRNINVRKNIRICSKTLESISVEEYKKGVIIQFDVPNLQKFHFVGCASSSFAFEKTRSSRVWESDICIVCNEARASWLPSLRKLLSNFSMSKVSLSINLRSPSNYIHDNTTTTTTTNEHIPGVESLNFSHLDPNADLLYGLILISRPKLFSGYVSIDLLEHLRKNFFLDESRGNYKYMHGLEEVKLEWFDMSLGEWQPLVLPLKTFLDKEIRFRLRWGTEARVPR